MFALELLGRVGRAGAEIVAVTFCQRHRGTKIAVAVKTRAAVREKLVARPLYAGAAAQLRVRHATVVAGAAAAAGFPGFEGAFGIKPFAQRRAVLVAKIHAARVIEKDVSVGLGG